MQEDDNDNKVGYKKPPRNRQFKPGRSGNPSGKKKGLKSISAELREILSETVTFTSDGAIKTMSKQRALASSLVSAAIAGDLRATAIVMGHVAKDHDLGAAEEAAAEPDEFQAVRSYRKRRKVL